MESERTMENIMDSRSTGVFPESAVLSHQSCYESLSQKEKEKEKEKKKKKKNSPSRYTHNTHTLVLSLPKTPQWDLIKSQVFQFGKTSFTSENVCSCPSD